MRQLIISCSLSPKSRSAIVAKQLASDIADQGDEVELLDLREIELPFCDAGACYGHPNVAKLKNAIGLAAAADTLPLEYVDETLGLNAEWVVEHISPRAVLFIACENDKVAPVAESKAMFECAGEPKKLVIIEGRGHYEAYIDDTFKRVMAEATAWYGEYLAGD